MKILIILNGISRKKKKFYRHILPPIQHANEVTIVETQRAGHALDLAKEAAQKFEIILAAGGDGTLHQVLNGVMSNGGSPYPVIGVIPLGTGNDFARLVGKKLDGKRIALLLHQQSFSLTDVGKIRCYDENGGVITRYFINVCSLGMGPEVVKRLSKSNRAWGPTLTYLKAITQTFMTHLPQPISLKSERWEWSGLARVVAIANGKSFGNGLLIAPDADPDDGSFNVFTAGELPLTKFLLYLQTIKSGKKIVDEKIHYHHTKHVTISSSVNTVLEAEGELQGYLPAKIEVMPKAIRFLR